MKPGYWLVQTAQKPLFGELQWSRPENKLHAGKLLIIGGSAHGFAAPAAAYGEALAAGAGSVHALLPDALRKIVGVIMQHADYVPSTPSGSFSQKALAELLSQASQTETSLIAGDLGRNSETAILIEKFLQKYNGPVTITKDAVDYVTSLSHTVLERPKTLLVLSLSQLQRLSVAAKFNQPVKFSMDLLKLVEWLHDFTTKWRPFLVVRHHDQVIVAVSGKVSTTKIDNSQQIWRLKLAAKASVWWMQNPGQPFAAITTAVL